MNQSSRSSRNQPGLHVSTVTLSLADSSQAVSLCHYLDTHREELNLVDKAVLEIGAGTGLVSIVAVLRCNLGFGILPKRTSTCSLEEPGIKPLILRLVDDILSESPPLENNRKRVNLQGKEVLELGAGTGLVTIVASLLGASVTATDLPDVLGNLRSNVMRNTRGRCKYTPQVEALSWGHDLERKYPPSLYRYDYVLAADVVYHHDYLDELLVTMKHFCKRGTTVIWANKVRFETDLTFTENFKKAFHTSLLAEDGEMKIFMGTFKH